MKERPDHYQKIQAGKGTVMRDQFVKNSNYFDVTLRNNQHPFHSSGVRQISFNDVNYNELKQKSRFGDSIVNPIDVESPKKVHNTSEKELFYDIKGNSFKNTLIPEDTA